MSTKTPSLAHLSNDELIREFEDRASGSQTTLQDWVLCAFWDDFELTEEQFKFLFKHYDEFRKV